MLISEKLKSLINKNTSLIILNSPSNPTGGLISKIDMDKIVEILDENPHVKILSDEIYSRIVYKVMNLYHCYPTLKLEID